MILVLEAISDTQAKNRLELYALLEVTVLVSDEHTGIVLHVGGKADIQYFEELIADSHVPVNIEVTELAVVVGVLEILVSISLCVPCAFTVGFVKLFLQVKTFSLLRGEQAERSAQCQILVLVCDSALERQTEFSAEVARNFITCYIIYSVDSYSLLSICIRAIALLQVAAEVVSTKRTELIGIFLVDLCVHCIANPGGRYTTCDR